MVKKLKEIKKQWDDKLQEKYGGELEIDYINESYYAYAFHNEPKIVEGFQCDSWLEKIEEIDCIGNSKEIEQYCIQLGIHVCH